MKSSIKDRSNNMEDICLTVLSRLRSWRTFVPENVTAVSFAFDPSLRSTLWRFWYGQGAESRDMYCTQTPVLAGQVEPETKKVTINCTFVSQFRMNSLGSCKMFYKRHKNLLRIRNFRWLFWQFRLTVRNLENNCTYSYEMWTKSI